jgi:hypothetical protein
MFKIGLVFALLCVFTGNTTADPRRKVPANPRTSSRLMQTEDDFVDSMIPTVDISSQEFRQSYVEQTTDLPTTTSFFEDVTNTEDPSEEVFTTTELLDELPTTTGFDPVETTVYFQEPEVSEEAKIVPPTTLRPQVSKAAKKKKKHHKTPQLFTVTFGGRRDGGIVAIANSFSTGRNGQAVSSASSQ